MSEKEINFEGSDPFGPEFDNRVPGELLVKLNCTGERSITESIPSGPIRRICGELPKRSGIKDLDNVLNELEITSISKVHSPLANPATTMMEEDLSKKIPGIILRKPPQSKTDTIAEEMSRTYRLRFDANKDLDEAVKKLSSIETVSEVSYNYYRFSLTTIPNDPRFNLQWGLAKINCPMAWDRCIGSASVVVAVVDSGIDLDHPDLQANLIQGYDYVNLTAVNIPPGWHLEGDFLVYENNPQDEVGHGTHVAGIISAETNNATGVAGVAWQCRLMPVRVLARLRSNSSIAIRGWGTAADIAAGVRYATDHGAHVINMSLGAPNNNFVEGNAIAYAISRGCIVVAAMGNDDSPNPCYPAAYPNVVAVGAINQSEKRVTRANTGGRWGSNTGHHISLVAPGVDILSTMWNDTYDYDSGTSMATAFVSGVAALIKSCKPNLTGTEIANILRYTAIHLSDIPTDQGPNDQYGYGLVDAKAAIERACPLEIPKSIKDHTNKLIIDSIPKHDHIPIPKHDHIPIPKPNIVTRAPFVLATPHHFTGLTNSCPATSQETARGNYEEILMNIESTLAFLDELSQEGGLTETGMQQLESLRQQYNAMLLEYQKITQQE